jgi:hypothetical protein
MCQYNEPISSEKVITLNYQATTQAYHKHITGTKGTSNTACSDLVQYGSCLEPVNFADLQWYQI